MCLERVPPIFGVCQWTLWYPLPHPLTRKVTAYDRSREEVENFRWGMWEQVTTQCQNLEYSREMQNVVWVGGVSLVDVVWKARIWIVQKGRCLLKTQRRPFPTKNYLERVRVGWSPGSSLSLEGWWVNWVTSEGFSGPKYELEIPHSPPPFRKKLEAILGKSTNQAFCSQWSISSGIFLLAFYCPNYLCHFRQPHTFEHPEQGCKHAIVHPGHLCL